MAASATRTRVLSFHADYHCRSSGACCTSGWSIAVEPQIESKLRHAVRVGSLRWRRAGPLLVPEARLPDGARCVLGLDPAGRCVAFEPDHGRHCAIHRQLGHESLPASCRQFPRIALLGPSAVSLTLSHYCPTAAGLLFRAGDEPVRIVDDPPLFPLPRDYEGLDARIGPPPLLRPGVFVGWDGHALWEEHSVRTLGDGSTPVETSLAALAADAEAARGWEPGRGPLVDFLAGIIARPRPAARPPRLEDLLPLRAAVVASVPPPHGTAELPEDLERLHARLVAPAWASFAPPVRRYLAAKAFACWWAVQGNGLRTAVRGLAAALALVHVEAARACARAGRLLDADLLRDAFRAADLLLVHLASPEELARQLGAAE